MKTEIGEMLANTDELGTGKKTIKRRIGFKHPSSDALDLFLSKHPDFQ